MRPVFQLAWERFKIISTIIGDVEGRVIATLFYFTILMPFGLASRLLSDPLALKRDEANPIWVDRAPSDESLDSARRQG